MNKLTIPMILTFILALIFPLGMMSSCSSPHAGKVGGGFVGSGTGFGIAKAAGANKTTTVLLTVGGAVVGGIIGDKIHKDKVSAKEWQQLKRESTKVKGVERTIETLGDGSTQKRTAYLHKNTEKRWDLVEVWSAPKGNSPPKLIEEYAIWMD